MKETVEGWSALECLPSMDETPGSILSTTETHKRQPSDGGGKARNQAVFWTREVTNEGKAGSRQGNDVCTGI